MKNQVIGIGSHKMELDTPILCIDLDVMESNIEKMSSFIRDRGKAWRPHQKCHKTPAIAWKQINAGAIGVTCAKVTEAEVMAAAGIRNILIANMIVGNRKLERVVSLCRNADPIIAVDNYAQAEPLAAVCKEHQVECRVIIEIDMGLERVGCKAGDEAIKLARKIADLNGINLIGVMGYEGHILRIEDPDEKMEKIQESVDLLIQCRDLMLNENLNCEIVSCGGTGSYQYTSDCDGVTELQAGGGIFADPMYQLQCGVKDLEYSLTVLATVVSRPVEDRAILDTGRKTLTFDIQKPLVKEYPDAEVVGMSAEHMKLQLNGESRNLKIGDKIELIVGYADFSTMLHDNFYAFRNNQLETIWPIQGRGKLQ